MNPNHVSMVRRATAIIAWVFCLLLLCAAALADDAPWVAELSDSGPHDEGAREIDLWVPSGEYVTVGMYTAEDVKVWDHPFVRSQIYRIHFEARTVFDGLPDQRQADIAHYLSPGPIRFGRSRFYRQSERFKHACRWLILLGTVFA